MFSKPPKAEDGEMSVVCKIDGNLVSLIVDAIGDVVEIDSAKFEPAPHTVPGEVRRFIKGIYKLNGALLSVLDLEALAKELSPSAEAATARSA
jgi:purine-binding chemotaxis protein CheW